MHRGVCVLDLDHTLIHSRLAHEWKGFTPQELDVLELIAVRSPGEGDVDPCHFRVKIRPGAIELIEALVALDVKVYIFTAGLMSYAHVILSLLDPQQRLIPLDRVFARDPAIASDAFFKDVSLVMKHAGVPLDSIIIVDDRRDCWRHSGAERNVLQVPAYEFLDFESDESARVLDIVRNGCSQWFNATTTTTTAVAATTTNSPIRPTGLESPVDRLSVCYRSIFPNKTFLFVDVNEMTAMDGWLDGVRHGFRCVTTWSADVTHIIAWSRNSQIVRTAMNLPVSRRPRIVTPQWLWQSILHMQYLDESLFAVAFPFKSNAAFSKITMQHGRQSVQQQSATTVIQKTHESRVLQTKHHRIQVESVRTHTVITAHSRKRARFEEHKTTEEAEREQEAEWESQVRPEAEERKEPEQEEEEGEGEGERDTASAKRQRLQTV